jgi:hypothetical protein
MSADGYFYGTRRRPLFVALLCLYPREKFVFKEPPQLSLSFT